MRRVFASKIIPISRSKLRDLVWQIDRWSSFWSPLDKVELLYDDGLHQDFNLTVQWQGAPIWVRTVRFSDANGNIHFFSQEPPPPLTVHQGVWQFTSRDHTSTELTAIRWFELPALENESLSEYSLRLKKFSYDFQARLQKILISIGEICEK